MLKPLPSCSPSLAISPALSFGVLPPGEKQYKKTLTSENVTIIPCTRVSTSKKRGKRTYQWLEPLPSSARRRVVLVFLCPSSQYILLPYISIGGAIDAVTRHVASDMVKCRCIEVVGLAFALLSRSVEASNGDGGIWMVVHVIYL
jgi:hypothetical protein